MKTILRNAFEKTCLLVLMSAFLFSGCTLTTVGNNPPVNTPTPEVFLPLDPSPTPLPSDLPLSCQFSDLKVYVNRSDKYCFAYPDRFQVTDQGGDLTLLQGPVVGTTGGDVNVNFKVELTAFDVNKSLDQHVDEFMQGYTVFDPSAFEHTRVTVDGEPAILVERASEVVDDQPKPKQMNWRMVFVHHGSSLYRLIYQPADIAEAKADLDELYQMTMGSFAFLEQNLISDPPVSTDTPAPTPLPPTPVPPTPIPPTPTASIPCDWMSFVADVTVPDGTTYAPVTTFVKTWRLKNIGTCTWTPSYSLVFVSGDQMGGPSSISLPGNVPPGYTVDVSVALTAPTAGGSYTGYWMLRNAMGSRFGSGPAASGIFLVNIKVTYPATGKKVYVDNTGNYSLTIRRALA